MWGGGGGVEGAGVGERMLCRTAIGSHKICILWGKRPLNLQV